MNVGDAVEVDTWQFGHSLIGGPIADRGGWWPATVVGTPETMPEHCKRGHVLVSLDFDQKTDDLFDADPGLACVRPAGVLTEELRLLWNTAAPEVVRDDSPCCEAD